MGSIYTIINIAPLQCGQVRLYVKMEFLYLQSQPKHPWCKKSSGQKLKKGRDEKDVKLNWAAKAS